MFRRQGACLTITVKLASCQYAVAGPERDASYFPAPRLEAWLKAEGRFSDHDILQLVADVLPNGPEPGCGARLAHEFSEYVLLASAVRPPLHPPGTRQYHNGAGNAKDVEGAKTGHRDERGRNAKGPDRGRNGKRPARGRNGKGADARRNGNDADGERQGNRGEGGRRARAAEGSRGHGGGGPRPATGSARP